jgi:hypothetical protein
MEAEVELIDVRTNKRFKKFLTKNQFENLPDYLALPHEVNWRKANYKKLNKLLVG